MSLCDIYNEVVNTSPKAQAAVMDLYLWLAQYNGLTRDFDHPPIEIDESTLVLPENWGQQREGEQRVPTTRLPTLSSANYDPVPVSGETWDQFLDHLLDREGYRNAAYYCSEGFLTIGVGHRVLDGDGITENSVISDERVRELLEADASKAFKAAIEQANELGINDSDFIIALGSVNFQLGCAWRSEFSKTWQHMKDGNFDQAMHNIENSKWVSQTSKRTDDFVRAIAKIKDNPSGFDVAAIDTNFNAQAEGAPQEPEPQVDQPAQPLSDTPSRPVESLVV